MEQASLKYVKMLVGFTVIMAISAFSINGHIKRINEAKLAAEAMSKLDESQQQQVMNALNGAPQDENAIRQLQVADEMQQQENINREPTPEEQAAIEESMNRKDLDEQQGLKYMGEGNLDMAILSFEKAIENGDTKTKIDTSKYLAQCYEQKGDLAGMINTYNQILPLVQDQYEKRELNEKIADCFIKSGNKEQALKYYEENYRMLQMPPDLVNICELLMENNDKTTMQGYLDEHLARFPNDRDMFTKYLDWLNS